MYARIIVQHGIKGADVEKIVRDARQETEIVNNRACRIFPFSTCCPVMLIDGNVRSSRRTASAACTTPSAGRAATP